VSHDDYSAVQSVRDAQYERDYRAWVDSLSEEDRRQVEQAGVAEPMLARHGNGSPDRDLADSPLASHTPDIAALVDHEDPDAQSPPMRDATEILRHLVADLISEGNARLTLECLAVALGLSAYNGESMTDIAKRHGITRAAVSKRCVDITERLNLPPSRAMRSEMARKIYRKSQLRRHRRSKS
jgi:hypothetical protein